MQLRHERLEYALTKLKETKSAQKITSEVVFVLASYDARKQEQR